MESFSTLKNRFVSSVSSAIEKADKTMVHLGTSDGEESQYFYLKDKLVVLESLTVYVGDEIWEETEDISTAGATDRVFTLTYAGLQYGITTSRTMVTFGDGINGKIPDVDEQILVDYESARFAISDYELCVLFHNSVNHVVRDFGVVIDITSVDYDTASLDIEYDDDMFIDLILYKARMEYEIRRINAEDAIYMKSQHLVVDGKQVAKSQKEACEFIRIWYKDIVRAYIKSNQVPRFTSITTIFGSSDPSVEV